MKKRQRNKMLNKLLNEDELKVIELYRACESVNFYKYYANTYDEAVRLCGIVGAASYVTNDSIEWFQSAKGKIEVTAFIKKAEVSENDRA